MIFRGVNYTPVFFLAARYGRELTGAPWPTGTEAETRTAVGLRRPLGCTLTWSALAVARNDNAGPGRGSLR